MNGSGLERGEGSVEEAHETGGLAGRRGAGSGGGSAGGTAGTAWVTEVAAVLIDCCLTHVHLAENILKANQKRKTN